MGRGRVFGIDLRKWSLRGVEVGGVEVGVEVGASPLRASFGLSARHAAAVWPHCHPGACREREPRGSKCTTTAAPR